MLDIKDLAQSKLRSPSLDKLHGQRKAIELIYSGDKVDYAYDDEVGEGLRQRLEKITGKSICIIDKGGSFVSDFFSTVDKKELIDLEGEFYEIKFKDFSLYLERKFTGGWINTFMDAREIILPPKSTVERGIKRLYILRSDSEFYALPELEYPKAIAQFLKWAKKKKKLGIEVDDIWNHSSKIVWEGENEEKRIDWIWTETIEGYLVKNIKTEDDLVAYNLWLQSDYKKMVEESNAGYKSWMKNSGRFTKGDYNSQFWKRRYARSIPNQLIPIQITGISQADVDQYIEETNNRYKVSR